MTLIKHPRKLNQTERVVVPKHNNHQSPEADTGHELTCVSCGREIGSLKGLSPVLVGEGNVNKKLTKC
jgi:hypothetical protein